MTYKNVSDRTNADEGTVVAMTLPPRPIGAASTHEILDRLAAVAKRFLEDVGSELDNPEQQEAAAQVVVALALLRKKVEREGVEKR